MREILFKGKRKDNGEWVEGGYFQEPYTDSVFIIVWNSTGLGYNEFIEIIPETLCRFTGLWDKNNKMIWEKDIVKHYNNPFGGPQYYVGVIRWSYEKFRWANDRIDSRDIYGVSRECVYEVIGNTFDNPELLEVENESSIIL